MSTGQVFKQVSRGNFDFTVRHAEYGSDLTVDVYENGRYIETTTANLLNFDSQLQKIIDRNLSY